MADKKEKKAEVELPVNKIWHYGVALPVNDYDDSLRNYDGTIASYGDSVTDKSKYRPDIYTVRDALVNGSVGASVNPVYDSIEILTADGTLAMDLAALRRPGLDVTEVEKARDILKARIDAEMDKIKADSEKTQKLKDVLNEVKGSVSSSSSDDDSKSGSSSPAPGSSSSAE